jgi:REP element-mobilizing transposase RayT
MRAPRERGTSNIYHIVARGSGRQLIFEDDDDRKEFLAILSNVSKRFSLEIYAWCLMGNHVHLLIHADMEHISPAMQVLLCTYAMHYNEKTGRSGHLFQERFGSEPVDTDEHLLSAMRYIHLNPEKARIEQHDRYCWSSYAEYLGEPGLCSTDFILSLFGNRQEYVSFHDLADEDIEFIDVARPRYSNRPFSDSEAIRIANSVLGGIRLSDIKTFERGKRNRLLNMLLDHGLSIRQTERLTGIGRGTIAYARQHDSKPVPLAGNVTANLSPWQET